MCAKVVDGVVTQVIVAQSVEWCKAHLGGTWMGSQRPVGIGYAYDETLQTLTPPQPYPSWTWDAEAGEWMPPVPYPGDGDCYDWDEESQSWRKCS